jgi:hypothetical protein
MKLRRDNYKQVLNHIIKEEITKQLQLKEIFDSKPFKTQFELISSEFGIECKQFKDIQNNIIKVIFHKMRRECYEIDFTVNGSSFENENVSYSLKEYTSLISTIFKCIEQFLKEYNPLGIVFDGSDSSKKIDIGKEGQKNTIYKYALQSIDIPPNYSLLTNENSGAQILKKQIQK